MPTADEMARAESRAREARTRALREGNAGRTADGIRHARAGLRQLGWDEDRERPLTDRPNQAFGLIERQLL